MLWRIMYEEYCADILHNNSLLVYTKKSLPYQQVHKYHAIKMIYLIRKALKSNENKHFRKGIAKMKEIKYTWINM